MKKAILSLIVIFFGLTAYGEPVSRQKVVFEIGTGTWCPFCVGAAMGADDLIENGHEVAIIKNHNGDAFANVYSNARNSYYGVSGYPNTRIDGILEHAGGSTNQSLYPVYLNYYNQRIDVPSPFTVAIYFENTGGLDWDASIEITEVSDDYDADDLVLHFAVTETDIPYNWQNQNYVKDALRLMAPDQFGTSLDFSSNDVEVVDLSFTLDQNWEEENMSVIAFVQDVPSKEIFQANIVHLQADFHEVTFDVFDDDGNEITDAIVTFDVFKNSPGDYSFNNIPGGDYQYKVEKDGYKTVVDEVTVDDDMTINIVLEEAYEVTFIVTCETTEDPLEGAWVELGDHEGETDEDGIIVFDEVFEGTYEWSVSLEDYLTQSGDIEITEDTTVEIELESGEEYTVTFEVENEYGYVIDNAVITLGDMTNQAGDYEFIVIPGEYDYLVEAEYHLDYEGSVDVDDDITVNVIMEPILYSLNISADPEEGGSVDGEGEYYFGEEVTISAEANENYEFVNWSGDTEHIDDPESETATVTMPAGDVEIVANFNDVTSVEKHDAIDMVIFPNPARNRLTVESNELIKQIRLINVSGQMVKEISVDALSSEINVSNLHQGIYFVQIHTKESIITKRVQVAR